jgi:hypothetical protein
MSQTYNIYCDESSHLENDHQRVMVLGAVWCPLPKTREISQRLREIKQRHGVRIGSEFEVKWNKVSPAGRQLYIDLLDYFFDDDDLHFRALVIPDKSKLHHETFGQDHDTWYYKMWFDLLKVILSPEDSYRIYLDIKDARSSAKVEKLHEVLANNLYDFSREIVERVQQVRSHEVEILQLADLLTGAVSYANRELSGSPAKLDLVRRMRERSGYSLVRTTLLRENKANLFVWRASEARG